MSGTRTHAYVTCDHDPDQVYADILNGELVGEPGEGGHQVQWCSRCGAYRHVFGNPHDGSDLRYGDWTEPELRKIGPAHRVAS